MGIGDAISFPTTATRHLLDANVTFGMSGDRFNARDAYRRDYDDSDRAAAGLGTTLAVALPVATGVGWAKKGFSVPGLPSKAQVAVARAEAEAAGTASKLAGKPVMRAVAIGVGGAALATAAYVGARNTAHITEDDGHFGAVGSGAGVIAGTAAGVLVGKKLGGKVGAATGLVGLVAGGVAGRMVGKQIDAGPGHIGEEHKQAPQVDENVGDRIGSFTRGAVNHFNENGPTTQGIAFGPHWGIRETVREQYSNSERAGAMHGDLAAAALLGGGALAVTGGLVGRAKHSIEGATNLKSGAVQAGKVLDKGLLTNRLQSIAKHGAAATGLAAVGIAGALAAKDYSLWKESFDGNAGAAAAATGATVAAAGATAIGISGTKAFAKMAPGARAANSALVAVALVGALSAARLPVQQFVNDARDSATANGGLNVPAAVAAGGVGALAGGYGAFKALNRVVPEGGVQLGKFHVPKGAIVGVGTALAAGGVGGAGLGLSSTMPGLGTVAVSTAGGAVLGAAVGAAGRGITARGGAIAGAALGMTASSMLRSDEPKASVAA